MTIDCVVQSKGHVTCKDPKGSCCFVVKNKSGRDIKKFVIDGCIFTDEHKFKRCDFAVSHSELLWLVELKGTDFTDAVEQLISTLKNESFLPRGVKITPVIVLTKSPLAAQRAKHLGILAKFLGDRWSGKIEVGTKSVHVAA